MYPKLKTIVKNVVSGYLTKWIRDKKKMNFLIESIGKIPLELNLKVSNFPYTLPSIPF